MAKATAGDESVTFRIYDLRLNGVACDKNKRNVDGVQRTKTGHL